METDPNARVLEGQRGSAPAAEGNDDGATAVGGDAAQSDMQSAESTVPVLQDRRRPKGPIPLS